MRAEGAGRETRLVKVNELYSQCAAVLGLPKGQISEL